MISTFYAISHIKNSSDVIKKNYQYIIVQLHFRTNMRKVGVCDQLVKLKIFLLLKHYFCVLNIFYLSNCIYKELYDPTCVAHFFCLKAISLKLRDLHTGLSTKVVLLKLQNCTDHIK